MYKSDDVTDLFYEYYKTKFGYVIKYYYYEKQL